MKLNDLDASMRRFETANDLRVLPGIAIVARVDGRGLTKLTKRDNDLEKPFDERFQDMMVQTAEHLMDVGLRAVFTYTQSDEISLMLHRCDDSFDRKIRKLSTVIAGEASAKFTSLLGAPACFDCRLSQLPTAELVVNYFRWRHADAARNALNAHCYWSLRREGVSAREATAKLSGMPISAKHDLLFERGTNFNDLPPWQKRGVGVYWQTHIKVARDPRSGEEVTAERRRISHDLNLPFGDEFGKFVDAIVREQAWE